MTNQDTTLSSAGVALVLSADNLSRASDDDLETDVWGLDREGFPVEPRSDRIPSRRPAREVHVPGRGTLSIPFPTNMHRYARDVAAELGIRLVPASRTAYALPDGADIRVYTPTELGGLVVAYMLDTLRPVAGVARSRLVRNLVAWLEVAPGDKAAAYAANVIATERSTYPTFSVPLPSARRAPGAPTSTERMRKLRRDESQSVTDAARRVLPRVLADFAPGYIVTKLELAARLSDLASRGDDDAAMPCDDDPDNASIWHYAAVRAVMTELCGDPVRGRRGGAFVRGWTTP